MSPVEVVFALIAAGCIGLGLSGVYFLIAIYWRNKQ